jgi:hypothetical protein
MPPPGHTFQPAATAAPTVIQIRLQLIDTLVAESNRAAHYPGPVCVRQGRQLQRLLEKQVATCDAAIAAATVLAELPELGKSATTRRRLWWALRLTIATVANTRGHGPAPVGARQFAARSAWRP